MIGDNNNDKPSQNAPKSLNQIFLEYANPDCDGFTKEILISDLVLIDKRFSTGNGGSWCRSDGSLKKFNIVRHLVNNKIYSVKLDGYNKNAKERQISSTIRKAINKQPCAVLAIGSSIECDHKDGMYDDISVGNIETQKLTDFQPLAKNVNLAKRQHCKVCKETDIRFDAKRLGYSESYIKGNGKTKSCKGCYWYDPQMFNSTISKDFKKEF